MQFVADGAKKPVYGGEDVRWLAARPRGAFALMNIS